MGKISRRGLLRVAGTTGVMLTVPAFLQNCGGSVGRLPGGGAQDPIENARAAGLETPVLAAINCGITAPNPHNTQAWKFLVRGALEFDLYVDEERILPDTDPATRQIHIGCGTFLEHCVIGASRLGYSASVILFPEGTYARPQVGRKPVARVSLARTAAAADPLYDQIVGRATNRTEYEGPMVTDAEFAKLRDLVGRTHATLEFDNNPESMAPFTKMFYEAMEIEMQTPRTAEESRIWFRLSDEDIYKHRDGISLRGGGFSGIMLWIVRTFFFSMEKEKFHSKESQAAYLGGFKDKLASAKAHLFWRTATNTPFDWVRTGRDYARTQLALARLGLVMHPLSQILQEYPEMDSLRKRFEARIAQRGRQKVQMLVRVGRSGYHFTAPRRPVRDMLMKV